MTMKNRPVPISKLVDETRGPPQGDTTAKPIPAPKDSSSSVNDSEAAAPASTAAQLTPESNDSTDPVAAIPELCSITFLRRPIENLIARRNRRFQTSEIFRRPSVASARSESPAEAVNARAVAGTCVFPGEDAHAASAFTAVTAI